MKILNYSYLRKNLRSVLDDIERTNEPVCVVSKKNQAVLISKKMYDEMIERVK